MAKALALGMGYFLIAAITVRYTRFEGGVAFIWAASGLLSGVLVAMPRAHWPAPIAACAAASMAATWLFGLGAAAAAPLAAVNVGEAMLGAWLAQRFGARDMELQSFGAILAVLVPCAVLAPVVSGVFGAAVASVVTGLPYGDNWVAWVSGHALGTMTFAPLVILMQRGVIAGWIRDTGRARRLEAVALVALVAATTVGVFAQTHYPLLFLPLLPMMVAVFRLGRFGATVSVVVLAVVGIACTVRGLGPVALIDASDGLRAQFFQLYLASAVLMVLPAAGDLKRRKQTIRELEEQATLRKLILDRTDDVIMTFEVDGRVRFASPSVRRVLGRSPESLVGFRPQGLVHPADLPRVIDAYGAAQRDPDRATVVEYRVLQNGREIGWFESHTRAMVAADGTATGAVSIIRNVTDRKAVERRLEAAATIDALTGVGNRRAFDAMIATRQPHARSATLALFDLDRFKAINDVHGHAAGDRVLRAFAHILRGAVRDHDLVARLGGEEFVAVIEGADLDAARIVCERVRDRFARHAVATDSGGAIRATVSAGIAPIAPRGSIDVALAAADAALYRAKAEGRNRLALADRAAAA